MGIIPHSDAGIKLLFLLTEGIIGTACYSEFGATIELKFVFANIRNDTVFISDLVPQLNYFLFLLTTGLEMTLPSSSDTHACIRASFASTRGVPCGNLGNTLGSPSSMLSYLLYYLCGL